MRKKFQPEKIRLLLVAESPPPTRGFFYDISSAEGSLSRNTREAFERYIGKGLTRSEFLDAFRSKCYLVDLFQERGVNAKRVSNSDGDAAVERLGRLLTAEKPPFIVSVLRRIDIFVRCAVKVSALKSDYTNLPYPNRNRIDLYRDGLERVFRRALE